VPPLPQTLLDLRARITAAIASIDHGMLQRDSEELDYRLDVCRVTKGAHIEHLWCIETKLGEFLFPSLPILCIWISLNVSNICFKLVTYVSNWEHHFD
jgi:hypothetical protein